MELLWRLNAEQGITVLMVTHEPDMAEYARRMVRFVDGVVDRTALNPHPVGLRGKPAPVVAAHARRGRVMLFNTILLALRSIRRNLMRSFLTILGIVIGVSAVITMVTLGNGATLAVQTQISSLGTNLLQVRPGASAWGRVAARARRHSRTPMPTRLRSRSAAFWRWRQAEQAPRWWQAGATGQPA